MRPCNGVTEIRLVETHFRFYTVLIRLRGFLPLLFWLLSVTTIQGFAQAIPDVNDFAQWQFIPRTYTPSLSLKGGIRFFDDSMRRAIGEQARSRSLTLDQKSRLFSSILGTMSDDWKAAIGQAWGTGLPTSQMLQIFDQFWDIIDRKFACFHRDRLALFFVAGIAFSD